VDPVFRHDVPGLHILLGSPSGEEPSLDSSLCCISPYCIPNVGVQRQLSHFLLRTSCLEILDRRQRLGITTLRASTFSTSSPWLVDGDRTMGNVRLIR
jgi:hypothetical protein